MRDLKRWLRVHSQQGTELKKALVIVTEPIHFSAPHATEWYSVLHGCLHVCRPCQGLSSLSHMVDPVYRYISLTRDLWRQQLALRSTQHVVLVLTTVQALQQGLYCLRLLLRLQSIRPAAPLFV